MEALLQTINVGQCIEHSRPEEMCWREFKLYVLFRIRAHNRKRKDSKVKPSWDKAKNVVKLQRVAITFGPDRYDIIYVIGERSSQIVRKSIPFTMVKTTISELSRSGAYKYGKLSYTKSK